MQPSLKIEILSSFPSPFAKFGQRLNPQAEKGVGVPTMVSFNILFLSSSSISSPVYFLFCFVFLFAFCHHSYSMLPLLSVYSIPAGYFLLISFFVLLCDFPVLLLPFAVSFCNLLSFCFLFNVIFFLILLQSASLLLYDSILPYLGS